MTSQTARSSGFPPNPVVPPLAGRPGSARMTAGLCATLRAVILELARESRGTKATTFDITATHQQQRACPLTGWSTGVNRKTILFFTGFPPAARMTAGLCATLRAVILELARESRGRSRAVQYENDGPKSTG